MLYKTILSTAIATLHLSPTILSSAVPNPSPLTLRAANPALSQRALNEDSIPFPFNDDEIADIANAFTTISNIPDTVLDDGPSAVQAWLKAHNPPTPPPPPQLAVRDDQQLEPRQGWLQVAKCAFAIGKAIAENAIPIAKLRRIKELIELLGGARKVAKLLLKAKSIRELIIIGGPELAELGEILLGFQEIVEECFAF